MILQNKLYYVRKISYPLKGSSLSAQYTHISNKDMFVEAVVWWRIACNISASSIIKSFCADKLDPLRGYDSSKQIALCKEDIIEGFKGELKNFYKFSKKKNRPIDECFFDVYQVYCKGDLNG